MEPVYKIVSWRCFSDRPPSGNKRAARRTEGRRTKGLRRSRSVKLAHFDQPGARKGAAYNRDRVAQLRVNRPANLNNLALDTLELRQNQNGIIRNVHGLSILPSHQSVSASPGD